MCETNLVRGQVKRPSSAKQPRGLQKRNGEVTQKKSLRAIVRTMISAIMAVFAFGLVVVLSLCRAAARGDEKLKSGAFNSGRRDVGSADFTRQRGTSSACSLLQSGK